MAEALLNAETIQSIVSYLTTGGVIKALKGIDDRSMDSLYAVAHHFYSNNRYQEAEKIFKLLCLYDHLNVKYFKGLASCQQMKKEYQQAAATYSLCYLLDCDDPEVPFQAAKCHLMLNNFTAAQSGFIAACGWAGEHEKHQLLKKQAERLLIVVRLKMSKRKAETEPVSNSEACHGY